MDTAHNFSYIILRLLTIPCPFSLSMLSWIFAQLRENKDVNSCHLKRQRTGKAEENRNESSRSPRKIPSQQQELSSRYCFSSNPDEGP